MRIIRRNLRDGLLKLRLETPEDVWHLSKVVEPGSIVRAKSKRKASVRRGSDFVEGDVRPVVLAIEVEKVAFQKDTGKLRMLGKVVSGPEDVPHGSYHTIQAEPGQAVEVTKRWKRHEITRMEDAARPSPRAFICMIDRDAAHFYKLLPSGPEPSGSIEFRKSRRPGEGEDDRMTHYQKIAATLEEHDETVIIAGPGFERENLFKHIKSKHPELAKRTVLEHADDTEISGVTAVIRRAAPSVLARHRVREEAEWVQSFLEEVRKDGLAVYGMAETKRALESGAVAALMVSEEKLPEASAMLDVAESTGAEIRIISSTHEAGEMFLGMGGVGAMLRYKLRE